VIARKQRDFFRYALFSENFLKELLKIQKFYFLLRLLYTIIGGARAALPGLRKACAGTNSARNVPGGVSHMKNCACFLPVLGRAGRIK